MITAIDYNNYRKGVVRHLSFRYGVDNYTAEDIFQDSYESFAKSLNKINDGGFDNAQLYSWVKAIARNTYLRQFSPNNRSKSKYKDKFVTFADLDFILSEMDEDGIEDAKSLQEFENGHYVKPDTDLIEQDFMNVINTLPTNHKDLYLAYIAGYSMDEISRMYHVSYGVLAVTINRIKKKIKKYLTKEGLYNE